MSPPKTFTCLKSFHSFKWDMGIWIGRHGFWVRSLGSNPQWVDFPQPIPSHATSLGGRVRYRKDVAICYQFEGLDIHFLWEGKYAMYCANGGVSRLISNVLDNCAHHEMSLQSTLQNLRRAYQEGFIWGVPNPWTMSVRVLDVREKERVCGYNVLLDNPERPDWHLFLSSPLQEEFEVLDMHPTLWDRICIQNRKTGTKTIWRLESPHIDDPPNISLKKNLIWTRLGHRWTENPHTIEFWDGSCWESCLKGIRSLPT